MHSKCVHATTKENTRPTDKQQRRQRNKESTQRGKQAKDNTQRGIQTKKAHKGANMHVIKQTCYQAKEGVLEGQM